MEAPCNRSVLLQAPELAAYFTPSSPRCFGKAGANGRSGWSPGRGLGKWDRSALTRPGPQASSAVRPPGRRPPACAAATGTTVREGGNGSG